MLPSDILSTDYPDFYDECEGALKAFLQEFKDFFAEDWQVSNDDTVIAEGGDNFIVLRPGSFPVFSETNTGQIVDFDWGVIMEVYVRYDEYEQSWANFKKIRAALIWRLRRNPTLICTTQPEKSATNVWRVSISSDEDAQYFRFDDTEQRPNFIIQEMGVTIRQRVEFPF